MTGVAVATHTSGTTAAWLVGDGAGAGWPTAVGGDAVGRPGALGRADGVVLADVVADGLGMGLGLAIGLTTGAWLGAGLAGVLEATAAGEEEAGADGGAGAGDDADAAGEMALSPLLLLVQAVVSRPMIMTAPSSVVRLDLISRWVAATGSG